MTAESLRQREEKSQNDGEKGGYRGRRNGYQTILAKWLTDKTGIETVKINRS